jgi:hypothetical protein
MSAYFVTRIKIHTICSCEFDCFENKTCCEYKSEIQVAKTTDRKKEGTDHRLQQTEESIGQPPSLEALVDSTSHHLSN